MLSVAGIFLASCTERYSFSSVDGACKIGDTTFFANHQKDINTQLQHRQPGRFTYALLLAGEFGQWRLVEFLLAHGAAPNVVDSDGNTVLIAAMNSETLPNSAILSKLVEAGADINAKNHKGVTALMAAAALQPAVVVESLLKLGADLNLADHKGNTALQYTDRTNIITVLLTASERKML